MKLEDLQLSHIYKVPAWGYCIYCGIRNESNLLVFRRIEDIENDYVLSAEYVHTVRMPLDHIKKLQAVELHNDRNKLLRIGDGLFFQNNNGILYGTIKKIHSRSCDLKVRNITREVHFKHLFTYETTFGNMQTRASSISAMQSQDGYNKKREVSEQVTH